MTPPPLLAPSSARSATYARIAGPNFLYALHSCHRYIMVERDLNARKMAQHKEEDAN